MITKNKFCLKYKLEHQAFTALSKSGYINIKKVGYFVMVDDGEIHRLQKGIHYVECPYCHKKAINITSKHYDSCKEYSLDKDRILLYSSINLKNRKKTEGQKEAQSKRLIDRFKTEEGALTKNQIKKASITCNSDPTFLEKKREIGKKVQNREDMKKLHSKISKEMWKDPSFIERKEEYVQKHLDELQYSASRARTFLKKTSKVHLQFKEKLINNGIKGFITEYSCGYYSIDEADPLSKIAIEVDGCYWHGCDLCNFDGDPRIKSIDKSKNAYLTNRGWTILRIKEHDIKSGNIDFNSIKQIQNKKRKDNIEKIRKSYRLGVLKVKSFNTDTDEIEWKPILNVVRHNSEKKKIYDVYTNTKKVGVTGDHSLFSFGTNCPIKVSDLNIGSVIIGEENYNKISLSVIDKVQRLNEKYTYDLSVKDNENFFLASGILAHNSYSISGVSLDVDKSSKYESLKNNYIQEYDKARDLAKRSIKIVKGLKQPRYGVGISSALGPYSRPGTQSRRNFVSGFGGGWS